MGTDYYVILGVPLDAAPEEIRSAYRRLARVHHPDRTTDSGSGAFRRISEAYGVLSDPERRARYDHSRHAGGPRPLAHEAVEVAGRREAVRPSYEALLDRLARNFGPPGPTKGEHLEPLTFELILNPDEAARGLRIPFRVPLMPTIYSGTVEIRVPAGVRDGTVIEASLASLGVRNLWLRVYVRIARH